MITSPGTAFARRLKQARERRRWTQHRLARELTSIGWHVDRAQVAKIESQDRRVSLDEAIMIAWVLSLPPAYLYLPVGEEDDVALAPDVNVHPDLARKWVLGKLPSVTSDQRARMPREWYADIHIWTLFDNLDDALEHARKSEPAMRSAEYVGDRDSIEAAREQHVKALQLLADSSRLIANQGLRPPAIDQHLAEMMRKVGVAYDGPTYPGPVEQ